MVERMLRHYLPAQRDEDRGYLFDHRRVKSIAQPFEFGRPPADGHYRGHAQRATQGAKGADSEAIHDAALQPGDRRPTDSGADSNVLLCQITRQAEVPNHPPDLHVVGHCGSVGAADRHGLIAFSTTRMITTSGGGCAPTPSTIGLSPTLVRADAHGGAANDRPAACTSPGPHAEDADRWRAGRGRRRPD